MVVEVIEIKIDPERRDGFESAMEQALTTVTGQAEGVRSYQLSRCIETPGRYLLQVDWRSIKHHTVIYHGSAARARWRALVTPFFATPPIMAHFEPIVCAQIIVRTQIDEGGIRDDDPDARSE